MIYTVRLTHAAQRDIDELLEYLVPIAGQTVALGYIGRLKYFLARLEEFPKRGHREKRYSRRPTDHWL